jgi:hypothetical protein
MIGSWGAAELYDRSAIQAFLEQKSKQFMLERGESWTLGAGRGGGETAAAASGTLATTRCSAWRAVGTGRSQLRGDLWVCTRGLTRSSCVALQCRRDALATQARFDSGIAAIPVACPVFRTLRPSNSCHATWHAEGQVKLAAEKAALEDEAAMCMFENGGDGTGGPRRVCAAVRLVSRVALCCGQLWRDGSPCCL